MSKTPDDDAKTPESLRERMLKYTPVVMTVVATLLTGLSGSEMTAAQYQRASAAQSQSKVGDQWSYFQAKKARAATLDASLELLEAQTGTRAFDLYNSSGYLSTISQMGDRAAQNVRTAEEAAEEPMKSHWRGLAVTLEKVAGDCKITAKDLLELSHDAALVEALRDQATLPDPGGIKDAELRAVAEAVERQLPEREINLLAARVTEAKWNDAMAAAAADLAKFDASVSPLNKGLEHVRTILTSASNAVQLAVSQADSSRNGTDPARADAATRSDAMGRQMGAVLADFTAAKLRFGRKRYEKEAAYNRIIAGLYEEQVRHHNLEAERHRERSRKFFYGALAAQTAVIVSTLALAVRQKSVLWGLAACVGLVAVAFGVYVYLFT